MTDFNKIIIENLLWYNNNLLTIYNKSNKKTIEKFKEIHTKEIFKLIVNELKPFFNIYKSKNGKDIFIDTYEYIHYDDKQRKEHKLKLQEFKKIEPHTPNNYIMVANNHQDKQASSHEWLKNIVGLVKHNLKQDITTGHNEQIVSNEHSEKTSLKQKGRKQYINNFNNNKLFLQDNKTYKEYKTNINQKLSALKQRKSKYIIEETYNEKYNKEFKKEYIKALQTELYDILYKVDIIEEANEIKVNITEEEEEIITNNTETEEVSDKDIMINYWNNYNKRKLEEKRKMEEWDKIKYKEGVIFKIEKNKSDKEVKHKDNSYLYNFVNKYLSLHKIKKISKLSHLITNIKNANDNRIKLMEYNNNIIEVENLYKLVATDTIRIKHIIKLYNTINNNKQKMREFLKIK